MDDIKSDIRRVQAMVQGFIDANHSAPDSSPYKQFAHAVHNLSDIVERLATRLEACPWADGREQFSSHPSAISLSERVDILRSRLDAHDSELREYIGHLRGQSPPEPCTDPIIHNPEPGE